MPKLGDMHGFGLPRRFFPPRATDDPKATERPFGVPNLSFGSRTGHCSNCPRIFYSILGRSGVRKSLLPRVNDLAPWRQMLPTVSGVC